MCAGMRRQCATGSQVPHGVLRGSRGIVKRGRVSVEVKDRGRRKTGEKMAGKSDMRDIKLMHGSGKRSYGND